MRNDMDEVIFVVLLLNSILVLLFTCLRLWKREPVGMAVLFFFLPVWGFVIYYAPKWLQKAFGLQAYDRDSLVKRLRPERHRARVFVADELNVVSVRDAMAVSDDCEKRRLLLKQLKKDICENYRTILPAGGDKDSETAHYVAAAKMEVYGELQRQWTELFDQYESQRDEAVFHKALKALSSYIDSELLPAKEESLYKKRYCELVRDRMKSGGAETEEYENEIVYLLDTGQATEAEDVWKSHGKEDRSERMYMRWLQFYYDCGDKENFERCLDELRRAPEVRLTRNGLEKLRYWKGKGC